MDPKKNYTQPLATIVGLVFEVGTVLLCLFYTWTSVGSDTSGTTASHAVSIFGYVFSKQLVAGLPLPVLRMVVTILLGGWLFVGKRQRLIYLFAPAAFILLLSGIVESQIFVKHQTNFCAVTLLVLGFVRYWDVGSQKRRDGIDGNRQSSNPLPAWAFMLLVYYVGISYTYSGICKLAYSGLDWGDGRSLMLWVDLFSQNADNILAKLITGNHLVASILQTTTLVAELAAILMVFVPKLRPIIGITLVGFHLSIEYLMGLGFHANVFIDFYLLVLCYFVPDYRITGGQFLRALCGRESGSRFEIFPALKIDVESESRQFAR